MITQILKLVFFLQLLSHTNFATILAGLVEARKGSPSVHRLELGDRHQTYSIYRVIFLTGPPLKMSLDWPPPKLLGLPPPLNFVSVGIIFTSPDT